MRTRIQVDTDARVIGETPDGLQLESVARLRPGQFVDLVLDRQRTSDGSSRRACVMSWSVSRLGGEGTVYHGTCRWV
jgi:hypothetical protein